MKEIIDFQIKGNLIRFYLGKNRKQRGDGWHCIPYEHNAGKVRDEYIRGHKDICIPFNKTIISPDCGHPYNSNYSKMDMVARKIPCLIIADEVNDFATFEDALKSNDTFKYYFGNIV